jgi:hypothetical protein
MQSKPRTLIGPDGRERTIKSEERLNEIMAATFRSAAGAAALAYLKSISTNTVAGPEISDAGLRHLEGMRYLCGVISARIDAGIKQIAKVETQGEDK